MTHGINFLQVKNSLPIANASTAKIVSVLIPIESFCDHSINKIREIKSYRFQTCVCLRDNHFSE